MPRDEALAAYGMQVIVRERVEIPGPEDITIDHAANLAFVSSQRRRDEKTGKIWLRPEDQPGGAIFALDLSGETLAKRLLTDQERWAFRSIRPDSACSAARMASAGCSSSTFEGQTITPWRRSMWKESACGTSGRPGTPST